MKPGDENSAKGDASAKCELAAEVLRRFGGLRFAATGWSMIPTIQPRDTLVIERVHPVQLRVGDVALIGRGAKLCAHRVVSATGPSENRRWITQGDALPVADPPASPEQMLGRVTHLVRAGKSIPVKPQLGGVDRLIAIVVRRSFTAARAFVYLSRLRRSTEEPALL